MKKIQCSFLACIAFNIFTVVYAQTASNKDLFNKKVTYSKITGVPNASTATYKVEGFRNVIKIVCNGRTFSELGLESGKPKGPGPLPPGPNPCGPGGRCYPLSFIWEDNMIKLKINGNKTSVKVTEARGYTAFSEAIKKAPGKQIEFSEPQL